jgi:prepilin-type N-terminal cleavage/methylation domain-containing protein/prepilin-type processing-associated H-X9-DG protein
VIATKKPAPPFDIVFMRAIWQRGHVLWLSHSAARSRRRSRAFTLVELLVTIAILVILTSLLLPALAKAKVKAQTAACASNMKNWAYATQLYGGDFEDFFPPFGDSSMDYSKPFWHAKLAPYLTKQLQNGAYFKNTAIFQDELRKCPGGRVGPAPHSERTTNLVKWNCWIGAHFGFSAKPLTGPFYYADQGPPLAMSRIHKPADALTLTDTVSHYVYSPVDERYRFVVDMDGDGTFDSMAANDGAAYNSARPTVHNNGANVTLLDAHVERTPFKTLWRVDSASRVTHSFWYLED